ncbi:TRAP transporter large permease [Halanaerobiaceae bacterium Z-7014]|uniref:TRAP transporter large permease n=1 Tax=Halonatronomonas betaini TaxID=2778430 RepID=A0A931F627_9FIRM|nr:TRAP transporter large permease [Halonatronomonas betaini]MBF8436465.1 TRAP transporter large permease [Halonatronomonas betaini]
MLQLMVGIMFLLLFLGFPMMVPLIAAPLIIMNIYYPHLGQTIMAQQMIRGILPPSLLAVPMFILAADIMTAGSTARRLVDFVRDIIGHVNGGMAITTSITCTLFGAVSGSTQATVVAIGGTMRPYLLEDGYDDSFTTALIINSSDIALLIPPSIGMIIYGVVSGSSIGELFIAGIGPGILIMILFSAYCYIYAKKEGIPVREKKSWGQRLESFKRALLAFGFPIIIIGGIYSGLFSPTEASAVSVLYAFILEVLIYRNVHLNQIKDIALSTGMITAVVFILVGVGNAFSWLISFARIPQMVLPPIIGDDPTQVWVLFIIAVAFFIGCMFVDPIVVIMVLTPLFQPYVDLLGIDPILVGTVVTLQAAIGSATPPFGCDIFTAIAVFRRPYLEVIRKTPVFIAILLFASALLIFFPQIALFLRDLAFGYM